MVWFDVRDRQGKLHELVFTALRIANEGAEASCPGCSKVKATNTAKLD
jgi:hypothetical protein